MCGRFRGSRRAWWRGSTRLMRKRKQQMNALERATAEYFASLTPEMIAEEKELTAALAQCSGDFFDEDSLDPIPNNAPKD